MERADRTSADKAHPDAGSKLTPSAPEATGAMDPERVDHAAGRASAGERIDDRESELWAGRTHWKHFAGRILAWIVLNVVFAVACAIVARRVDWLGFRGGATACAAVVLVTGIEMIGRRVILKIMSLRYRLTSQRLFIERGILSRTIDQMELIRVDDVRMYKGFLDRVFGLGSVTLVSTDATDREVLIEGIASPDAVAESIRERMRTMRRKSLFIENL